MSDVQILTMTIALVFPALSFGSTIAVLLINDKRMDKRFEDFEKRVIEKLDNGFEHMELLLKLHETEHHKH